MQELGKVRVRVPSAIKAGDVVRVRAQVMHPMERLERDARGQVAVRKYNYITRITVTYLGKPLVAFDTTQSVSENPIFSFTFRATEPGPLKVSAVDTHGGAFEGTADIRFR